ncbi:MAG: hypothetical protein JW750_12020 [Anaerolineaceae bacterium]|nr:hypothetical protein [Anaerolineaceae bacterium]
MSRRTTGAVLIFTAAFLYAAKFIAAATFGSGLNNWNSDLFRSMLRYVDQGLTPASVIALIAGIIYLIWAEIEEKKKRV